MTLNAIMADVLVLLKEFAPFFIISIVLGVALKLAAWIAHAPEPKKYIVHQEDWDSSDYKNVDGTDTYYYESDYDYIEESENS